MRGLLLLGWLVFFAILLWSVLRVFPWRRHHPREVAQRPRELQDELVKDPVCQTYVVRSRAVTRRAEGTTHYFCSPECAGRFRASDPA